MKSFDTEETVFYDLLVYNAEKIADGTQEPIKAGRFCEENMPRLEKINEAVKAKGFDTFEIETNKITTKRYLVK
ncbi:hypothetical protein [Metabacillus sp. Hm71]|uniref:hypothetical protein n=1 Tax=Metabacillus sp. Hm71 TaxID=3450743 RepID=UPI003F42C2A1